MATSTDDLIKLLDFLAPGFAALPADEKAAALAIAAAYRPPCLTESKQDVAQVYYAAYLLYMRQVSQGGGTAPIPFGVKSEKEGDLARTYGNANGDGAAVSDPYGYYDQWKRLADICGTGAILVGNPGYGGCCGNTGGYEDH